MNRIVDLVLFVLIFIPTTLFLVVLSILTVLICKYPPLYLSKRYGKNKKEFTCLKLQTLKPPRSTDKLDDPEADEKRLTKLGKIYRDHGWDELPQIFNIFLGHMSFIGPRPISVSFYKSMLLENKNKKQKIENWNTRRTQVLPGLSGWHQVHLTDHDIIKFDNEYLDSYSLYKRMIIFYRSVLILIIGKRRFFGEEIPNTYLYKV